MVCNGDDDAIGAIPLPLFHRVRFVCTMPQLCTMSMGYGSYNEGIAKPNPTKFPTIFTSATPASPYVA